MQKTGIIILQTNKLQKVIRRCFPLSRENNKDVIADVDCSVKNCVYNAQGKCSADNISINCKTAVTEGETSCHTFELK